MLDSAPDIANFRSPTIATGAETILIQEEFLAAISDDKMLFFDGNSEVFYISLIQFATNEAKHIIPSNTWILFDSNPNLIAPHVAILESGDFIIRVTSPRNSRTEWESNVCAYKWTMKAWSLSELLIGRAFQKFPVDAAALRECWRLYTSSVRSAFQYAVVPHAYQEEEVLINTIKQVGWKTLQDIVKHPTIEIEISHHIIRVDPDRYRLPIVSIATRHISDLIFKHLLHSEGRKVAMLLSVCRQSTALPFMDWLMDRALHNPLTGIGQWEVRELEREMLKTESQAHWKLNPQADVRYLVLMCAFLNELAAAQVGVVKKKPTKLSMLLMPPICPYPTDAQADLQLSGYYTLPHPEGNEPFPFNSFLYDAEHSRAIVFAVITSG